MASTAVSVDAGLLVRYFMNIRLNKVAELKEIVELDQAVVHAISRDGFNGFQLAAKYGFVAVAEILLASGVIVDVVDAKYGRTFLHWASINGHNDIIVFFTRNRNETMLTILNLTDFSGFTALMYAVKGGRVDIVRLLLAAGASLTTTVQVGAEVKTVFDLCNRSEELVKILRQEETSRQKPTEPLSVGETKDSDLMWGLSGTTHLSQHSQTRKKCVEVGWCRMSAAVITDTAQSSTANKNVVREAIVKLNRDDRELRAELTIRTLLNTPITTHEQNTVDSSTCIKDTTTSTNPHIVQLLLHPDVVTVANKGGVWCGILLEKGLLDLHHLCDYMHQHATHSRLHDLCWKIKIIIQLCNVCIEFSSRNVVWYDLKPSNFIVFPASDAINDHENSTKLHHWLQHSTWNTDTFALKAADLSSVYAAGDEIDKTFISCTAKYLHPSVASVMSQKDCHKLVCSSSHMMWSFGMTVLQLLHNENKTLFAYFEVANSEQVYAFLTQDSSILQCKVNEYIQYLVQQQCHKGIPTSVCTDMCNVLKSMLCVDGCASFQDVKTRFQKISSELS